MQHKERKVWGVGGTSEGYKAHPQGIQFFQGNPVVWKISGPLLEVGSPAAC